MVLFVLCASGGCNNFIHVQEAVGWLVPASHLFWGAWAVVQAGSSAIDFDYLSYARMRFQGHRLHCHAFLPPSEYALGEK